MCIELLSLKMFITNFQVESIRLQGLEHALSFTATDNGSIYLRSYKILLKKSGQRTPRIELEEIGNTKVLCNLICFVTITLLSTCIKNCNYLN